MSRGAFLTKRLFDVALALPALILLAPLMGLVALLVAVKLGRPVLFRQQRPGLHGKPFHVLKFRSMTDARGPDGQLLSDAERLPPFGRLLRATSLDELPQLWNVVKGELSLVGPRPLLMAYLDRYSPEQARRHEVPPGITGWAQVNGHRGETDTLDKMQARVEYDLEYLRNWSLGLDLVIILRTVKSVWADSKAY